MHCNQIKTGSKHAPAERMELWPIVGLARWDGEPNMLSSRRDFRAIYRGSREEENMWRRMDLCLIMRGADLTFPTRPAAGSPSECQIQSLTRNLYLLVVLCF